MKAAYFVGAGLSRAIARSSKPIPMMEDYIKVMAAYVSPEEPVILTALAQLEEAESYPYEFVSEEAKQAPHISLTSRGATDSSVPHALQHSRPGSTSGQANRSRICSNAWKLRRT